MLIRDVKNEETAGVYQEFQSNIQKVFEKSNNFIASLFSGLYKKLEVLS